MHDVCEKLKNKTFSVDESRHDCYDDETLCPFVNGIIKLKCAESNEVSDPIPKMTIV